MIVTYTEYGSTEEVPFEWLRISLIKKKEVKTSKNDGKKKLKFITVPDYLKLKPEDSEAERKRKKRKLDMIQKKNKKTKITIDRQKQQNSWLKFRKKISGKTTRKESIFRTRDVRK